MEFVKSEENLANPLTKGLTKQLVYDTSKGMGLKLIEWITHDENQTYVNKRFNGHHGEIQDSAISENEISLDSF